jgi:hypothetical protein
VAQLFTSKHIIRFLVYRALPSRPPPVYRQFLPPPVPQLSARCKRRGDRDHLPPRGHIPYGLPRLSVDEKLPPGRWVLQGSECRSLRRRGLRGQPGAGRQAPDDKRRLPWQRCAVRCARDRVAVVAMRGWGEIGAVLKAPLHAALRALVGLVDRVRWSSHRGQNLTRRSRRCLGSTVRRIRGCALVLLALLVLVRLFLCHAQEQLPAG